MFDKQKLTRYKYFEETVSDETFLRGRYVFCEDSNDVLSIYQAPYEKIQKDNDRMTSIIVGENYEFREPFDTVVKELSRLFKFSLHTKSSRDPFKDLFLGRTEIILWPISSAPFAQSTLPILTAHTNIWIPNLSTKGSSTYFIDQFHYKLWISFVLSVALICCLSSLVNRYLRKFGTHQQQPENWNYFTVITNQGGDPFSKYLSRNILLIVLAVLTFIFHSAFGAFLSAHLAIRFPNIPFSNLDELLVRTDYTICAFPESASFYRVQYAATANKHTRILINTADCPPMFNARSGVFQSEICPMDNIAVFADGSILTYNELAVPCNLKSVSGKYFFHYFGMLVTPDYKHRDQLNTGMMRLATAGIANYLQQKILPPAGSLSADVELEGSPVTMQQTMYVLMIPIAGILLALCILLVERRLKN